MATLTSDDNTMFVSKILSTFFGIQKAPVRFELKKRLYTRR